MSGQGHFYDGIKKLEKKRIYPMPVISSSLSSSPRRRIKTNKIGSTGSSCGLPQINNDVMSTFIISCSWNTTSNSSNIPPTVQQANVLAPISSTSFFNDAQQTLPNLNYLMSMVKVCYNTISYATSDDLNLMTMEPQSSPSWCVYGFYQDSSSGNLNIGFPSNGTTSNGCGNGQVGIIGGGPSNEASVWLKLVTFDDITTVYEKLLSYKSTAPNGNNVFQVSSTIVYAVPPARNCKVLMASVAVPQFGVGKYITPTLEMPTGAQFGILNTKPTIFTFPSVFDYYIEMTMKPDVTTQTISNDGMLTMYMGSGGDINIYTLNETIPLNPPLENGFQEGCGIDPNSPGCIISSIEPLYNIYTNIQNNQTTNGVTWTLGFKNSGNIITPFLSCQDNNTGQLYTNLNGCPIKTTNMITIYLILQDWFPEGMDIAWGPYFGANSINDLFQVIDSNGFTHIGGRSYVNDYCDCPDCSTSIICFLCHAIEDILANGGCELFLDTVADLLGVPYYPGEYPTIVNFCSDIFNSDFCPNFTGCDSC